MLLEFICLITGDRARTASSSVFSSYSSPPWLGFQKSNDFLAWRCENLFVNHSSPSPSYPPHHRPFTPVQPGYGIELFEDDYLFLPAADLRMDPASRPRPVSSVAFAYLGNALQLDHSIERRYI
jgi:hypothetical protein